MVLRILNTVSRRKWGFCYSNIVPILRPRGAGSTNTKGIPHSLLLPSSSYPLLDQRDWVHSQEEQTCYSTELNLKILSREWSWKEVIIHTRHTASQCLLEKKLGNSLTGLGRVWSQASSFKFGMRSAGWCSASTQQQPQLHFQALQGARYPWAPSQLQQDSPTVAAEGKAIWLSCCVRGVRWKSHHIHTV